MINAPIFAASNPQSFYQLLMAAGGKTPGGIEAYARQHPEFGPFGGVTECSARNHSELISCGAENGNSSAL